VHELPGHDDCTHAAGRDETATGAMRGISAAIDSPCTMPMQKAATTTLWRFDKFLSG